MKALFFDIDGTLVSFTTHNIPQSAVDAIRKVREKGNLIIIATGRPKAIIDNLNQLEDEGLIDGYVTMNGGHVFVGNEVLSENPIPQSDMEKVMAYTEKLGVTNVYMDKSEVCLVRDSQLYREIFYDTLGIHSIDESDALEAEAFLKGRSLYQITTFLNATQEEELMATLEGSEVTRWHPAFIDIMGKGNKKSKGIEVICNHFHIAKEDAYAFGDGGNDVSMLQYAGTGIAMGNAAPEVQQQADFITRHIDEDGIAYAIEKLGL